MLSLFTLVPTALLVLTSYLVAQPAAASEEQGPPAPAPVQTPPSGANPAPSAPAAGPDENAKHQIVQEAIDKCQAGSRMVRLCCTSSPDRSCGAHSNANSATNKLEKQVGEEMKNPGAATSNSGVNDLITARMAFATQVDFAAMENQEACDSKKSACSLGCEVAVKELRQRCADCSVAPLARAKAACDSRFSFFAKSEKHKRNSGAQDEHKKKHSPDDDERREAHKEEQGRRSADNRSDDGQGELSNSRGSEGGGGSSGGSYRSDRGFQKSSGGSSRSVSSEVDSPYHTHTWDENGNRVHHFVGEHEPTSEGDHHHHHHDHDHEGGGSSSRQKGSLKSDLAAIGAGAATAFMENKMNNAGRALAPASVSAPTAAMAAPATVSAAPARPGLAGAPSAAQELGQPVGGFTVDAHRESGRSAASLPTGSGAGFVDMGASPRMGNFVPSVAAGSGGMVQGRSVQWGSSADPVRLDTARPASRGSQYKTAIGGGVDSGGGGMAGSSAGKRKDLTPGVPLSAYLPGGSQYGGGARSAAGSARSQEIQTFSTDVFQLVSQRLKYLCRDGRLYDCR